MNSKIHEIHVVTFVSSYTFPYNFRNLKYSNESAAVKILTNCSFNSCLNCGMVLSNTK